MPSASAVVTCAADTDSAMACATAMRSKGAPTPSPATTTLQQQTTMGLASRMTCWASAVVRVLPMPMAMASATMSTPALEHSTPATSATAPEKSTTAAAPDIPTGDCDCNGNQADALGVCGGDCAADTDSDGVCDSDEIEGCANPFACNYDTRAPDDDGSCLTADDVGAMRWFLLRRCRWRWHLRRCRHLRWNTRRLQRMQRARRDLRLRMHQTSPPATATAMATKPTPSASAVEPARPIPIGDGVCDSDEVEGCTNPFACNYDDTAHR